MTEIKEEVVKANKAFKCKLDVNDEKIINFFRKNCSAANFAYNYARRVHAEQYKVWGPIRDAERARLKELFKNEKEFNKAFKKFCSENKKKYVSSPIKIRDEITARKNAGEEKFVWLKEAAAVSYNDAVYLDYNKAIERFNSRYDKEVVRVNDKRKRYIESGQEEKAKKLVYPFAYGFPRFKKKGTASSFHLDNIKVSQVDYEHNKIFIPGLPKWMKVQYGEKHDGYVKIWHNRRLPKFTVLGDELSNPVISTDGIDWYLSVGYLDNSKNAQNEVNNNEVLGIDLGLKESIITSDGRHFPNPANDRKYVLLRRRLNYLKRALSKNQTKSPLTKDLPLSEHWKWENKSCKAKRLEKAIKRTQIKIRDLFDSKRKLMVAELLKSKPAIVVVEKMNVKGMQKFKKIAPKMQESAMSQIRTYIINACKRRGIEIFEIEQNKGFASTQICSNCGYKNTDIAGRENLGKRVFKCPNCGAIIDRDENAAINLKDAVFKHSDKLKRL